MNWIRLEKLPENQREEYLRDYLNRLPRNQLVSAVRQYDGVVSVKDMSKVNLINLLVDGLLDYAERQDTRMS